MTNRNTDNPENGHHWSCKCGSCYDYDKREEAQQKKEAERRKLLRDIEDLDGPEPGGWL